MESLRDAPHIVVLAPATDGLSAPGAASFVYFRPMIGWALAAASGLPRGALGVSGPASEAELTRALKGYPGIRSYGSRTSPRDAARAAAAAESEARDVLVLDGARVLLTPEELSALLARHGAGESACTFLASPDGAPAGAWCFRREALDAEGELACERVPLRDPADALAIAGLDSLASAERILQDRLNGELLRLGVRLEDPGTTRVDPACRLAPGAVVEGGCRLTNAEVGEGCVVRYSSVVESSRLGKGCGVGPFARISGSDLDDEASAGSYAELENTSLGRGTRAGGHSCLRNCKVGRGVEIGRGFLSSVPAGARQTVIEDDSFIGDACHVVNAVTVGRGAFIATGTSITDDAPAGSFVISRGRQVVKTGHDRSHAPRRRP